MPVAHSDTKISESLVLCMADNKGGDRIGIPSWQTVSQVTPLSPNTFYANALRGIEVDAAMPTVLA